VTFLSAILSAILLRFLAESPDIVYDSDVPFFFWLNIFHSSFRHQPLSGLVTDSFCLILSYRLQNVNSLSVHVHLNNYIPSLYQKYSPDIMLDLFTYFTFVLPCIVINFFLITNQTQ